MTITKFKISGKEFVIVPRREYERVAARLAEDARDVRKAKAALAHYRRTKRGTSLEQLKREMNAE
jgi:F420-dependent methylenetetrahydromethanopterin dehydrogenase